MYKRGGNFIKVLLTSIWSLCFSWVKCGYVPVSIDHPLLRDHFVKSQLLFFQRYSTSNTGLSTLREKEDVDLLTLQQGNKMAEGGGFVPKVPVD